VPAAQDPGGFPSGRNCEIILDAQGGR
jgi:hypothetical protein